MQPVRPKGYKRAARTPCNIEPKQFDELPCFYAEEGRQKSRDLIPPHFRPHLEPCRNESPHSSVEKRFRPVLLELARPKTKSAPPLPPEYGVDISEFFPVSPTTP